jgi:pimeloyl-ACP methyl ester carboxylesterase
VRIIRPVRIIRSLATPALAFAGLKLYGDYAVYRARLRYPPLGRFVATEDAPVDVPVDVPVDAPVDGAARLDESAPLRCRPVHLHYLSRGAGQPVLFLHAAGLVLRDFASIFEQTAAAHRAIALDRPGYGYSERPDGVRLTPALNVRLVRNALRRLGIARPILVGHSAGGSVALRYALDYPDEVAGLVLVSAATYAEGLPFPALLGLTDLPLLGPLFRHTLLPPLTRAATGSILRGMFAPGLPSARYTAMVKAFIMRPTHFEAYADEFKHLADALAEQSPRYGEIQVPVTILAGREDMAAPPESQAHTLHRAIAHSRLVVFPETGHFAHHQHPQAVLNAIRGVQEQGRAAR